MIVVEDERREKNTRTECDACNSDSAHERERAQPSCVCTMQLPVVGLGKDGDGDLSVRTPAGCSGGGRGWYVIRACGECDSML